MTDKSKGFWASIPGILTGLAAVITAMTGLFLAVNNNIPPENTLISSAEVVESPSSQIRETSSDFSQTISPIQDVQPVDVALIKDIEKKAYDKLPDIDMSELLDCKYFPTVNTVRSLMGWSDHYHKEIIAAGNNKGQASRACKKTIEYRGMAHCKAPNDLNVRQALFETLTLCRVAGFEWTDINQSTSMGKVKK